MYRDFNTVRKILHASYLPFWLCAVGNCAFFLFQSFDHPSVQQSGLRFLFGNIKLVTCLDMAKNLANVRMTFYQMGTTVNGNIIEERISFIHQCPIYRSLACPKRPIGHRSNNQINVLL